MCKYTSKLNVESQVDRWTPGLEVVVARAHYTIIPVKIVLEISVSKLLSWPVFLCTECTKRCSK